MAAEISNIEHAYAALLHKLRDAARRDDRPMIDRVFASIQLFEELWPDDCKRWNDRFSKSE